MEFTTYNIYVSRNGLYLYKVAELNVPPEGCWWSGTFIQGPDWPEMVQHEDGSGYAYRADLDEEPSEEDYYDGYDASEEEAFTSIGWGTDEDYGYYG